MKVKQALGTLELQFMSDEDFISELNMKKRLVGNEFQFNLEKLVDGAKQLFVCETS
jgi:hypothetical protein